MRTLIVSFITAVITASNTADAQSAPPTTQATPSAEQSGRSFEWLGEPREISRAWSASRDTPALDLAIVPRPVQKVGGELALFSLRWPAGTFRTGIAAFIELEFDGETDGLHAGPWPGASSGQILWRGSYAFFAALTPRKIGAAICAGCRVEATLSFRHESQHYTGSNRGGEGFDVSAQPYVGDSVEADFALSQRFGDWYFAERVVTAVYLPQSSSYVAAVGADVHARFLVTARSHPFVSLYGEYRFGDTLVGRAFPDAYRARMLAGIALPSALGDVMIYLSADVGHRYGLRILTEEATLGCGVRLALGTTAARLR